MKRITPYPGPLAAVLAAALVLLAACGSSVTPPPGSSQTPTASSLASPDAAPSAGAGDAGAIEAATSVLQAVQLDDPGSFAALEGIRFSAAGAEAAAAVLGGPASEDARWAATYVYATSGTEPEVLKALVTATAASPTVRAMAAAGLVGRGDPGGFDVLIASIGGSDPMDGAEPAGPIWAFAADVLERFTAAGLGPTLAASDTERQASRTTWEAWLTANRASLRFDGSTQRWVTP